VKEDDLLVGLNPGAAWGSSKCWPPERFAAVGDGLSESGGAKIIVLAGPGEEGVQSAIVAKMARPVLAPEPGRVPLDVLKPLVKRLKLLVTNDTGPRHFANAFGIPSVVVMGPTDRRYTSNPRERAVVLQSGIECVPCHLKTCPRDHQCMLEITPEKVIEEALGLL
jgi:heptosyltransferase-2